MIVISASRLPGRGMRDEAAARSSLFLRDIYFAPIGRSLNGNGVATALAAPSGPVPGKL